MNNRTEYNHSPHETSTLISKSGSGYRVKQAAGVVVLVFMSLVTNAAQPQSTITPTGNQYGACDTDDKTDGELTFTTTQHPTPQCPTDVPKGDPDYYWDFGPLDANDNKDGTATMYSDVQGSYQVTVYCEQQFIDSNGKTYTADTQKSD